MAPYHSRPYEGVSGTNGCLVQHLMATVSDGSMIHAIVFADIEGCAGEEMRHVEKVVRPGS